MQNIKIAPTFFRIKNVVKIKNVKKRKKRDINKKRKKYFYISAKNYVTSPSLKSVKLSLGRKDE